MISFRPFQEPVFWDNSSGLLILHWSRQIGKSFTLAAWSVSRLIKKLESHPDWLVTDLSNSRENGAEFCQKAAQACQLMHAAHETHDQSPDLTCDNMRMEIRITRRVRQQEHVGRIKVLAANPRTARGFSGDLILDEFAFHEDSRAIWETAEPILAANPEFLCRMASTGNGRHNLFHHMAAGPGPDDGQDFHSEGGFLVSRVTRTAASRLGVSIDDTRTWRVITPEQARQQALDSRADDQNYAGSALI